MSSNARWPSGSRTRWGGSGGCPDRRPEGSAPDPHAVSCWALGVAQSWFYRWCSGALPAWAQRRQLLKAELELGDATVIRNAGGRVTPDLLHDLALVSCLTEHRPDPTRHSSRSRHPPHPVRHALSRQPRLPPGRGRLREGRLRWSRLAKTAPRGRTPLAGARQGSAAACVGSPYGLFKSHIAWWGADSLDRRSNSSSPPRMAGWSAA